MPKKTPEEVKRRARELYDSGVGATKIAQELGLPLSTIKSWRRREGWAQGKGGKGKKAAKDAKASKSPKDAKDSKASKDSKGGKSRKRKMSENSLRNLKPPFEKGNKAAVRHGIYADHSGDPGFFEAFDDAAAREPLDLVREQINQLRANIVLAQKGVDPEDPATLQAMARASEVLVRSIDKYYAILRLNSDPEGERLEKVDQILSRLDEEAANAKPEAE